MPPHKRLLSLVAVAMLIATSLVLATTAAAEGTTVHVDDDGVCDGNVPCYGTIQAAINAASAGDTIFVHNGTYNEQLTIDKALTLLAEDLDATVLNAGDTGDPWTITADDVTFGVAGSATVEAAAQAAAAAATHFVDDDGTCDENTPCYLTIQAAVNAAAPGDYVFVYAGIYAEHVTIGKPLTLEGEDRELAIVDGGGSGRVIYVTANNVTIRSLTATNGDWGIYLIPNWRIHHVIMDDLVVTDHTKEGISAGHSASWGAYHRITNSLIANNGSAGFYGHQFGYSLIEGNTVFGNSGGFNPGWGFATVVRDNLVYDNVLSGIWFDSMFNSVAENNRVWGNSSTGITLGYVARSNTVRHNAVCANGYGLYSNYPPVRYNRIYHNDVEGNKVQGFDLGSNFWDNGYPSGGNYWADYAGTDADLDGIGDTPYVFSGGQDKYPLMEPTIFGPPEVTAFTAPLTPIQVDTPLGVSATFDDPDSYFSHTGTWDWDGITTTPAIIDEATQTASGNHIYTEPGVYTVSLTLDDLCGPSGEATYEYVVVYDPDGGFVTGGGWIYSEPGAYLPNPLLEGKASFGFVSKYKKGATVPTGNTEFQFKTADLNFHSDSYQWLVVTGSDYAKFRGVGTINGAGEYKFQVWAGDGDPDTFRIKIWTEDETTGVETVVYDNGIDQALGGGSIIVHTKK